MSLLVVTPVILPPRPSVLESWGHKPHMLIVNGAHDIWLAAHPGLQLFLGEDRIVLANDGNAGVAASWNAGFKMAQARGLSHVALLSQGTTLTGGTEHLADLVDEWADWRGLLTDFAWHCIVLSVDLWEQVGPFDERFLAYYEDCLVPETPVLTADLRWVPVGDLRVGSEIIGVDEDPQGHRQHRRFRRSAVTRSGRNDLPCFRIVMEDGREVVASAGHRWLATSPGVSVNRRWLRTDRLRPGQRIDTPFNVWGEDDSAAAGWLAGIIDGEAHWAADYLCIAQREGVVLDRIKQVLGDLGIPFTWRVRPVQEGHLGNHPVANVEIAQRSALLELLGRTRPVRFMPRAPEAWEGRALSSPRRSASDREIRLRIESVEPVGIRETVSLETSTGTFIANGMVSHNCDYVRRLEILGLHTAANPMPKVERDQLDGTEIQAGALKAGLIDPSVYGYSGALYREKWGGDPGYETLIDPRPVIG